MITKFKIFEMKSVSKFDKFINKINNAIRKTSWDNLEISELENLDATKDGEDWKDNTPYHYITQSLKVNKNIKIEKLTKMNIPDRPDGKRYAKFNDFYLVTIDKNTYQFKEFDEMFNYVVSEIPEEEIITKKYNL